jgi:hypothetical protein
MAIWPRGLASRTGRGVLGLESVVVGAAVDLADARCVFRVVALWAARDWLTLRSAVLGLSECGWRVLPPVTITDAGFGRLRGA